MKKTITILLSLGFFLFFTFPIVAKAQNPGSAAFRPIPGYSTESAQKRIEHLQQIRERIELHQEAQEQLRETRRATVEARITTRRMALIRNFFGKMAGRFEAAINRLNRLIARIESRIAKIEAEDEGLDTAQIKTDLGTAKEKLSSASAALDDAKASLDEILSSDNPKEGFANLKDLIKEIKYALVDVHRILAHLIGDIRGLRVGQNELAPVATEAGEGE